MDRGNFSNIGEEIKNIVQNAVNTGDFHQLSMDIGKTVNSALDEVRNSIRWTYDNIKRAGQESDRNFNKNNFFGFNSFAQNSRASDSYNRNHSNVNNQGYGNRANNRYGNMPARMKNTIVPVGKISGILCTIFGNIGVATLGVASIVLMVVGHLLGQDEFYATIVLGLFPFLLISGLILIRGYRLRKRIRRMKQYVAKMGGRNYCLIKDLSASTGLSTRFLIKDLQKMIAIGMFPQGHIDEKKTTFMLDDECYKLYLDMQENIKRMKMEEQKNQAERKQEEAKEEGESKVNGANKDVSPIIEEGRRYIKQIKDANDAIADTEVSKKLERLEKVTGKIFEYVEQHPNQIPEIRKFMEYYLPTTLKLLEAYKEFDSQPVQGENITTAKREIEKTLDTINLAFENLLDDLFEDVAMDISTDITVLKTMLAQEGLTEDSLKNIRK
jgi:5-bromo-4-chloroindolyl phosphate hydrolysis protein